MACKHSTAWTVSPRSHIPLLMDPTRILCLGNEIVCDDGVGVRVGRVIHGLDLPDGVVVEFSVGLGLELVESLRPGEQLIIVDAMQIGEEPGTCQVMEMSEVEALAATPFCCHGVGLAEILKLARELAPERVPRRMAVVGVEAAVLDRFGTTLSDPIKDAVPGAVATVLRLAGAGDVLVKRGVQRAEELRDWEPDPTDVPGLE